VANPQGGGSSFTVILICLSQQKREKERMSEKRHAKSQWVKKILFLKKVGCARLKAFSDITIIIIIIIIIIIVISFI